MSSSPGFVERAACQDVRRREDILAHPTLNGIDFVQYEHRPLAVRPHLLVVRLLKAIPNPEAGADGAYGLVNDPGLATLQGGTRIVHLRVEAAAVAAGRLELAINRPGDFSEYVLSLGWRLQADGSWLHVVPNLDPALSRATVRFRTDCPSDFDCRIVPECPPQPRPEPPIDYLAKDYASFRQLLIDTIPRLNPGWIERSPADMGIALLELLAHEGDHLSYYQDAVANEAYLETARRRVSARRHARLVDYHMHDGRNAWTFLHVRVLSTGTLPQATRVLTRVLAPLRNRLAPPLVVVPDADVPADAFDADPALAEARVFETATPLDVQPLHNEIRIHAWGDLECCLRPGTTHVDLYAWQGPQAVAPTLAAGDDLLLEEIKGPRTGARADADPEHRQVVRLTAVQTLTDPAYSDQLLGGDLQVFQAGDQPLPLLRCFWAVQDALAFPLCLSSRPPARDPILDVSMARGNMVPIDDGRTIVEVGHLALPVPSDVPFRLPLDGRPLTMQRQPADVRYAGANAALLTPRPDLAGTVREVRPAVAVIATLPSGLSELWTAVPDLLDSSAFDTHFVAEVDDGGQAILRFGDGEYGREAAGATDFIVNYRVGNGRAGNVGREALAHVVRPPVAPAWPLIEAVRNPLPARDGVDAETIEEVRQHAPAAFRAEQFRAVTEADYVAAALKLPQVAGAVAAFRWTGSWHTVFVGIDPRDPEDLVTLPGGRTRLAPRLEARVRAHLTRYKLAGYDLEVCAGEYVPLRVELDLCVRAGYFRSDVVEAVRRALDSRAHPDGSKGFFHPDHFTFAQPVYLSRLYAAVEAVEGVDSLVVTVFERYGQGPNGELAKGVLEVALWQIVRLDNDPNFMENGVLEIHADGGK